MTTQASSYFFSGGATEFLVFESLEALFWCFGVERCPFFDYNKNIPRAKLIVISESKLKPDSPHQAFA